MFLSLIHLLVAVGMTSSPSNENALEWPREIPAAEASILMYQPQLETFRENQLEGRAAVSVTPKGATQPIFGAVWFSARVSTDRDTRLVKLVEIDVPNAKFPNVDADKIAKLTEILKREIPRWDLDISLDRILTTLELAEKEKRSDEQLDTKPPLIHYRAHPAVLVTIDGDPILQKAGDGTLMKVANSPFFIVLEVSTNTYFLKGGNDWLMAKEVLGPWNEVPDVPKSVLLLAAEETQEVVVSNAKDAGPMPQIIVSTKPAELIATEGEPGYSPIQGTDLLAVENTESDLFLEIGSQQHFVLLSGRWYSTSSLEEGPWTYVSPDQLPETFAKIPADSDQSDVLASIPGTDQALDAVLDTYVPQTAAIRRDDSSLVVEYDGEPKFEAMEGGDMEYAVNTSYSVIHVDNKYYCCHEAAWYEATSPQGPWMVCVDVPEEIYTIPPSYPVYNVKYVHVYHCTPEVVYVGYTPGYVGCYVYRGVVVYGTGYHYVAWHGAVYYPRPYTWGFAVRYNPYTGGWGFRVGYSRGGVWVGGGVRRGWWGAGGYRRADIDINRNVNINVNRNVNNRNIYSRRDNVSRNVPRAGGPGDRPGAGTGRRTGTDPARRQGTGRDVARTPESGPGRARTPESGGKRPNNVYADRDGNVHRKTDKGWQSRDKGGWSDRSSPSTERRDTSRSRESRPSTSSRSSRSSLERESSARQRGSSRASRSPSRGGGGRR